MAIGDDTALDPSCKPAINCSGRGPSGTRTAHPRRSPADQASPADVVRNEHRCKPSPRGHIVTPPTRPTAHGPRPTGCGTSRPTGSGCCSTHAFTRTLTQLHESEDAPRDWPRRARVSLASVAADHMTNRVATTTRTTTSTPTDHQRAGSPSPGARVSASSSPSGTHWRRRRRRSPTPRGCHPRPRPC